MRVSARTTAAVAATAALAIAAAGVLPATAAPAAPAKWKAKALITDLKSPKALTVNADGDVVLGQQGLADPTKDKPAKLVRYTASGKKKGTVKYFGKKRFVVAIAAGTDGSYWSIGADGRLYAQKSLRAKPKKVVNLRAYAKKNPDPHNGQDGPATESNPFGLAVTKKGEALVTDAAANSLLQVSKKGKVRVVARFAREVVKTDHVPADALEPGQELPPTMSTEAVPTSVAVAANGTIYVGELKGYPFRPGSSKIWKIKKGTRKAVCSVDPAVKAKKCSVAAKDLDSIAALAVNPAGGLVALQYAAGGVGVFEAGCFGPAGCPDAVVLKIKKGKKTELAKGRFSQPGGIVAYGKNKFYVTDHLFAPGGGRLSRLRG